MPLTEAEADIRSRWVIAARYGVAEDALKRVSIEYDDVSSMAQYADADGTGYAIKLEIVNGLVTVARIRRRPGPG
jgi:hypothetical protein